jgi:acetyl-CoA acetyltransferase
MGVGPAVAVPAALAAAKLSIDDVDVFEINEVRRQGVADGVGRRELPCGDG